MRIMCVDNNQRDLRKIMKYCLKAPRVSDVVGFTTEKEALTWLRDHPCDIAFMETLKAGFDGLRLAADAKKMRPEMAVIFVTDDESHSLEAYKLHAKGYLLKPSELKRIGEEIEYVERAIANPWNSSLERDGRSGRGTDLHHRKGDKA